MPMLVGCLCTDDSSYDTARESACRETPSDNRCPDTITRVCNDNPFDTLCNDTVIITTAKPPVAMEPTRVTAIVQIL